MKSRLFSVHARSPIHCGTGQAIGGIDLPIAREKPTNLPLVPGSSIKGVLRALGSDSDEQHCRVFGPPTERAHEFAGAVQFTDARLAFLPVRSVRGTFAWVSSPFIIRRLRQDLAEIGANIPPAPLATDEHTAIVTAGSRLVADGRVVFEDFDFKHKEDNHWTQFARDVAKVFFSNDRGEQDFFVARACLVHDDVMSVLLQTCTEITARIRLDPEKKTVEHGALWTEESLPVESLLAGLVVATPVDNKQRVDELFSYVAKLIEAQGGALQLGGNASVGRGLCRVHLVEKIG
jgi:CRISPR-associated protein Cmr4